jgi:hypothetical protein
MTTQEFIQQLLGMMAVSYNSDAKKVRMANDIEVSYRVELAEYTNAPLPLQMQLVVTYKGSYVMRHGAETEQDNKQLVECWTRLKNRAYTTEREEQDANSHEGYALLHEGLQ